MGDGMNGDEVKMWTQYVEGGREDLERKRVLKALIQDTGIKVWLTGSVGTDVKRMAEKTACLEYVGRDNMSVSE